MDDFDAIKGSNFGTFADRIDANNLNILAAKKLVFYYGLFVHTFCNFSAAGVGELPGNDFAVALGDADPGHNAAVNGRTQHAGIFMHEFGHNLGLDHGGGDAVNCKPNYLSVMKYNRMFPSYIPDRPLDYSGEKIADLVESNLDEVIGVPSTSGLETMYGPHIFPTILFQISATDIPIDWNRNLDATDGGVMEDLNLFV